MHSSDGQERLSGRPIMCVRKSLSRQSVLCFNNYNDNSVEMSAFTLILSAKGTLGRMLRANICLMGQVLGKVEAILVGGQWLCGLSCFAIDTTMLLRSATSRMLSEARRSMTSVMISHSQSQGRDA